MKPRLRTTCTLLLLALAVSGCRTSQEVGRSVRETYVFSRDSIFTHRADTFYFIERRDTVWIREIHRETTHHYSVLRDTVRQADTVMREKVIMAAADGQPKRPKSWKWFLAGAIAAASLALLCRVLILLFFKK